MKSCQPIGGSSNYLNGVFLKPGLIILGEGGLLEPKAVARDSSRMSPRPPYRSERVAEPAYRRLYTGSLSLASWASLLVLHS